MTAARVALITGAGAGIGRAAAFALSRAGFAVVCADLDGERARAVAGQILKSGASAAALGCDVASEASWPRILDEAASLGRLSTLISNAGIFPRIAFADTTVADFDRVMAVNLRAALLGTLSCVPVLRDSGGGSLVFMTSGSGLQAAAANPLQQGFSLYGASKAALDRWALGIAPELAPLHIAVNLLCPGAPVLTPGFERSGFGGEKPSQTVEVSHMAEAIAFLAQRRPQDGPPARYIATEFGSVWGQR